MTRENSESRSNKWRAAARWFLVLSYAVGSPVFAIVEVRTGVFSARFDYPPAFLHLVSGAQFICALTLFSRALAPWGILVLTVLALGAVYSHIRIDSPFTALPALAYTAIQAWYGMQVYRQRKEAKQ